MRTMWIDCIVLKSIFNSISIILWRPVHLSMLSWSSFNQYLSQYSLQTTGCFPTIIVETHGYQGVKIESCCNDYHQPSKIILAVLKSCMLLNELWGSATMWVSGLKVIIIKVTIIIIIIIIIINSSSRSIYYCSSFI